MGHGHGDRSRAYLGSKVLDEGFHSFGRDALRGRLQEGGRIMVCQKAEPTAISGPDHSSPGFRMESTGAAALIEYVTGLVGDPKGIVIRGRPRMERQVLSLKPESSGK